MKNFGLKSIINAYRIYLRERDISKYSYCMFRNAHPTFPEKQAIALDSLAALFGQLIFWNQHKTGL